MLENNRDNNKGPRPKSLVGDSSKLARLKHWDQKIPKTSSVKKLCLARRARRTSLVVSTNST